MEIASLLGVIGGFLHVVAFFMYHRQTIRGASHPNPATWSLWSVLSTLNAITYLVMTRDVVKTILPLMSTAALLIVFGFTLVRGKFKKLSDLEWIALSVGILGAALWLTLRSATFGNLVLQACIFISFVPTYRDVWRDAKAELPLPWLIWSFAYILTIVTVLLRWRGHYVDLVYPIHLLVLHLGVGLLAAR